MWLNAVDGEESEETPGYQKEDSNQKQNTIASSVRR